MCAGGRRGEHGPDSAGSRGRDTARERGAQRRSGHPGRRGLVGLAKRVTERATRWFVHRQIGFNRAAVAALRAQQEVSERLEQRVERFEEMIEATQADQRQELARWRGDHAVVQTGPERRCGRSGARRRRGRGPRARIPTTTTRSTPTSRTSTGGASSSSWPGCARTSPRCEAVRRARAGARHRDRSGRVPRPHAGRRASTCTESTPTRSQWRSARRVDSRWCTTTPCTTCSTLPDAAWPR